MRVKRGKLTGDKEHNKLFVWIDTDQTADPTAPRDELLGAYRDEIAFLRRELERKDHLLAAALERIPPQLEAPSAHPESPEMATEEAERPATGGIQEGAQRPWWRRVFRG
jgi:hypothetical protein